MESQPTSGDGNRISSSDPIILSSTPQVPSRPMLGSLSQFGLPVTPVPLIFGDSPHFAAPMSVPNSVSVPGPSNAPIPNSNSASTSGGGTPLQDYNVQPLPESNPEDTSGKSSRKPVLKWDVWKVVVVVEGKREEFLSPEGKDSRERLERAHADGQVCGRVPRSQPETANEDREEPAGSRDEVDYRAAVIAAVTTAVMAVVLVVTEMVSTNNLLLGFDSYQNELLDSTSPGDDRPTLFRHRRASELEPAAAATPIRGSDSDLAEKVQPSADVHPEVGSHETYA
ncbi:hypothetical protein R1sor_001787 [Riccia sorocarpa]|uniref:Uncharacterized protein n=1 Tax=Riccia sorocarpa TaxID=122646 RepID=A0ABD3H041_9MARC